MMNEFLLYRLPNGSVNQFYGKWVDTSMKELPNDAFFVTDFLKKDVFYFEKKGNLYDANLINNSLQNVKDTQVYITSKSSYFEQLNTYNTAFKDSAIQKAILSRIIKYELKEIVDAFTLFNRLCRSYPDAMVYLIVGKDIGFWCGATPEVLLSGTEKELKTMALAGTKWEEPVVWTQKEKHEQELVRAYIYKVLSQLNCKDLNVSLTKTIKAGPVYHLRNDFDFNLPREDWNKLIEALHPTPAVGGLPLKSAVKLINKTEVHNRKLYTGLIGYKGRSSLNIYVNLRCMELTQCAAYLYVGGGITSDSKPEVEWEETEKKALTLSQFLYLDFKQLHNEKRRC